MSPLRRRPAPATTQGVYLAAPVGGLNTIASAGAVPDGDCLQLYNMVSGVHGLRARLGYREFSNGATQMGAAGNYAVSPDMRTLLPYRGSASDGSKDRLFAVNDNGIYDMTSGSVDLAHFVSYNFGLVTVSGLPQGGLPFSGYGVAHAITTAAGQFLLYCDEAAGYWVYTESTDAWTQITTGAGAYQISGVSPYNLCFVTVWKSRVWFVEKDSTNAWYLDAGAIFGTATKLNLAQSAQFRRGGGLRGLWSWTLDGGIGIDDHLVAIGDGGDVAVYRGTDPADANNFALRGTWNAGALVAGRTIATDFGGDLLILTKSGIRPVSQLVAGDDGIGTYQTAKISNLFNKLTLDKSNLRGWAMHLHPEDNTLLVLCPQYALGPTEQLALSLWNRSWSRYRDLPITCACAWQGKLYFGDKDGGIWVNDGYVDGVTLADPTTFSPVQWACLTPFTNGDGRQKQVVLIKPSILADAYPPTVSAEPRYDMDLSELASVTEVAGTTGSAFDVARWDNTATWQDEPLPSQPLRNGKGVGSSVAIALRGTSRSQTVLVGMEVFLREGGFL